MLDYVKRKETKGTSVRQNIIQNWLKNSKNGLNSYSGLYNLGVEVGHLKTTRTDILWDTADYRSSSKTTNKE